MASKSTHRRDPPQRDSTPVSQSAATLTDRLAADIGQAVLDGAFTPGSRLDEMTLAERFQVSRTPVREALRQLAASGLIDIRPRRGAVVSTITPDQLRDMFGAMAEIEATCARLAALGMSPAERKSLAALHEAMGKLARAGAEQLYADANSDFHLAIYNGAHNRTLLDIAVSLRRRLEPFRRAQFRLLNRLKRSHSEHDTVVKAVLSGKSNEAHALMLNHVLLVEGSFEEVLSLKFEPHKGRAAHKARRQGVS